MSIPPQSPSPYLDWSAQSAVRLLFHARGGVAAVGTECVPRCGPVLICPNHLSDCDPLALYATCPRRDLNFIAKEDLFNIRILGPLIRLFGAIPIKRNSADRSAIRAAESILKQGRALVLFPEGRLSETGSLGEIQPGAALIALRSGAPIVPVGLARTNLILPYGCVIPQKSRLPARVMYGNPIEVEPFRAAGGRGSIDELTDCLEARIRLLTGQEYC